MIRILLIMLLFMQAAVSTASCYIHNGMEVCQTGRSASEVYASQTQAAPQVVSAVVVPTAIELEFAQLIDAPVIPTATAVVVAPVGARVPSPNWVDGTNCFWWAEADVRWRYRIRQGAWEPPNGWSFGARHFEIPAGAFAGNAIVHFQAVLKQHEDAYGNYPPSLVANRLVINHGPIRDVSYSAPGATCATAGQYFTPDGNVRG